MAGTPDRELLDALRVAERAADLGDLERASWRTISARPANAEEAELCRRTMLGFFALGRGEANVNAREAYSRGWVWRARALSIAEQVGWTEGVIALMQTEVFRLVVYHNFPGAKPSSEGYAVPDAAFEVLECMRAMIGGLEARAPLVPGIDGAFLRRLYFEKRGFLEFLRRDLGPAIRSYNEALAHADPERGIHKVTGARALCRFLAGEDQRSAMQETEAVRASTAASQPDIAAAAAANLAFMRGEAGAWTPYERI